MSVMFSIDKHIYSCQLSFLNLYNIYDSHSHQKIRVYYYENLIGILKTAVNLKTIDKLLTNSRNIITITLFIFQKLLVIKSLLLISY